MGNAGDGADAARAPLARPGRQANTTQHRASAEYAAGPAWQAVAARAPVAEHMSILQRNPLSPLTSSGGGNGGVTRPNNCRGKCDTRCCWRSRKAAKLARAYKGLERKVKPAKRQRLLPLLGPTMR
jgi:hypothetical protein